MSQTHDRQELRSNPLLVNHLDDHEFDICAHVCRANIPFEGLDSNRKKNGFALGFRVIFEENIKDGDLGVFFPFGTSLSGKILRVLEENPSFSNTIRINPVGHIIPVNLNGSYGEGLFLPIKYVISFFNIKLEKGYKITSENHLTVIGKTANVFSRDLRNHIHKIPLNSTVYCVEKIEGKNLDIEFKKTIFGRLKYKIQTDLHKEKVKKYLTNIVFDNNGKLIIRPKSGEIFNFKIVGRNEFNFPLKTLEIVGSAALARDYQKNIPFDYHIKGIQVYLTSISRKISKKEIIYYTWKTIENRAYENNLKLAPLLEETKILDYDKFLKKCIGLTDTKSVINNYPFKKGINLFIEHKEAITRIPYYSFKYIDAYYNSTFLFRKNFDLGY